MTWVLVFLGGMLGAPLRYLTDRFVQHRTGSRFPLGTMAVNVLGSLVLGLLTGLAPSTGWQLFLGTGFCGALTTYSTFSYETLRLAKENARTLAMANALLSVLVGLGAAVLGFGLAALWT
ncbi:fluoride efflux transporter CrcB [Sciscionella marina]|uniref:fluoride efflux transporter CrcB n=1 Tax=Sciscionella marina TaxID=508770 RepID=UPI0003709013|nr:fluoride efflux transporter CrcB [Sciscionella marina]